MPFHFGFYQDDRATKDKSALPKLPRDAKATWEKAGSGAYTLQRELTAADIVPSRYHIYELGEIEVTPNWTLWFSAQSWQTHLRLGPRLHGPGAGNRWQAYASMKFDGPSYGGGAAKDRVLVDRVILVSKEM